MPTYNPGDEKKYFSAIVAALIIIAGAIGFFFWSLLKPSASETVPPDSMSIILRDAEGNYLVNPGDGNIPASAPNVPEPTTLPPEN